MDEYIIENLRFLMSLKGINQRELADKVGVSSTSVNGWLTGRMSPSEKNIRSLVDILGTNMAAFRYSNIRESMFKGSTQVSNGSLVQSNPTTQVQPPTTEAPKRVFESNVDLKAFKQVSRNRVPELGHVAAGDPIFVEDNIVGWVTLPDDLEYSEDLFALTVRGDSMEPRMFSGDKVIFRRQEHAPNGATAIVLINGNTATCKKVYRRADGLELKPNNDKYKPLFFTPQEVNDLPVRVIGVVERLIAEI